MGNGIALLLLVCLSSLPAGAAPSRFLQDAARHLVGSDASPAATYTQYKKRTDTQDPALPYPPTAPGIALGATWDEMEKTLGLDKEVFPEPVTSKWRISASGLWTRRKVQSKVKGRERWIYRRRPPAGEPGVSVAKTGLETELSIERVDSDDWDFFVYDQDGKPTARSTFSTGKRDVQGPAPVTCLTCHYNAADRTFGRLPLAYRNSVSAADELPSKIPN